MPSPGKVSVGGTARWSQEAWPQLGHLLPLLSVCRPFTHLRLHGTQGALGMGSCGDVGSPSSTRKSNHLQDPAATPHPAPGALIQPPPCGLGPQATPCTPPRPRILRTPGCPEGPSQPRNLGCRGLGASLKRYLQENPTVSPLLLARLQAHRDPCPGPGPVFPLLPCTGRAVAKLLPPSC